ncbi:unnamed protein product [Rotaria sordida]|uniref:CCZ1/INTU/HSP4 first Longin domain-containing protein n=1 Tax=Rotaria sordida TaxID=392033 RepID=A0A815BFL0_9BILA|nr:unnamed protein product [Rotaria sordida]CAF3848638.1 unnamed protein product [Rotaria sordida]
MASKATKPNLFFFIFDFYLMKGAQDDNDILPEAILYFYPRDEQIRQQKLLDCGEIVGIVQYFQHDLFQSIPKTLYFQNTFVAHEHYGRHSGFLSLSQDHYTSEEAQIYLKHILDLFNMSYGTWDYVHSIYGKDNKMNEFLNQALTPIVDYVCNQKRSISHLFSTIEYTPLKNGNQRVLLESKHCLDYLKSKYGLKDGLIGCDNKVLYSTWDSDTTFYIQLLFQLRKQLPKNLVQIPWESEFKLKNGVSLFRIYIHQSSNLTSIQKTTDKITTTTTTTTDPMVSTTTNTYPKIPTQAINISDGLSSPSDDSLLLKNRFNRFNRAQSTTDRKHLGLLVLTDQSGSSEETGFETDTMDELSSSSAIDARSISSESTSENFNHINAQNSNESSSCSSLPTWHEESLTDEQKLENLHSRASTMSNDLEKTIKIEYMNSLSETVDRIHIIQVDTHENDDDDDDDIGEFQIIDPTISDSFHDRTTIISNPDFNIPEFLKSDRHELRVSWANISDKNIEHERDELVLYVQKNSRMMFVGVIQQSLLNDEYLKNLWNLMLSQMANMEAEIQVISTANEFLKLSTDVRFQFIENSHLAEFERVFDGNQRYRRIPSEESAYMALFARSEFKQNPECKIIGLSRGNHLISVDRCLPDRTTYSCRRFQETF